MGNYLKIYNGNPTAGGTDGTQVSEIDDSNPITVGNVSTTLSAQAGAGTDTVTLTSVSGYMAGQTVIIGAGSTQESHVIDSISGNNIKLKTALVNTQAVGATFLWTLNATTNEISVPQKLAIRAVTGYVSGASTTFSPTRTTLSALAGAGATSITVPSVKGFADGQTIVIGTATAVIATSGVNTVTNTITLNAGLSAQQAAGAIVAVKSYDRWRFSSDGTTWGEWGAALTFAAGLNDKNTVFHAQARALSGENPQNDVSLDFIVNCPVISAA